jgi:hypothetical protein
LLLISAACAYPGSSFFSSLRLSCGIFPFQNIFCENRSQPTNSSSTRSAAVFERSCAKKNKHSQNIHHEIAQIVQIPWERKYFGHTGVDPNADADGDGQSNREEYLADTNPMDPGSSLHITRIAANQDSSSCTLTWTSTPTRQYHVLERDNLQPATAWSTNLNLGVIAADAGATTTRAVTDTPAPQRFFRIQALRPLAP